MHEATSQATQDQHESLLSAEDDQEMNERNSIFNNQLFRGFMIGQTRMDSL